MIKRFVAFALQFIPFQNALRELGWIPEPLGGGTSGGGTSGSGTS